MSEYEVARRLIGGVWKTEVVNEAASGGSQPVRIARKTINYNDANLHTTGVLVATLAEGEILLPLGQKVSSTNYPIGGSSVFLPVEWDGSSPYGAFLGDNGIDSPYEFGSGVPLDGNPDDPAISGEPGHPDLWVAAGINGLTALLDQQCEIRDGSVKLWFRVSSEDDGTTNPMASQGQIKFALMIVAAP